MGDYVGKETTLNPEKHGISRLSHTCQPQTKKQEIFSRSSAATIYVS